MITQLGPYLIDEELAQGGMARVFRARLRGLGGFEKTLVIKQIRPELAKDPRFVELFVREANTLVSLSHPHIVPVYELGAADGTYYLSMEYVEGATVAHMLEDGPLTPALVAHLGAQVCEALDYAHGRFGVLHRDITPRNIIVDHAGHARLLDFGIATTADVIDPDTFGSPGYMAPEQVRGQALSPASDLFSLGCVLYEALTARAAFSKTPRATLGPAPTFTPDDAVPDALARLSRALLEPLPEARPASAAEVARQLRGFLAQTRPEGVIEDMQTRARVSHAAQRARRSPLPPAPEPSGPSTAKVEAQVIATSQVLTEMLRSAPGLAPMPAPPGEPHTRRIRERTLEPDRADVAGAAQAPSAHAEGAQRDAGATRARAPNQDRTSGALTAWMLKAWPALALLALLAAALPGLRAPAHDAPAAAAPSTPVPETSAPAVVVPPAEPPSPAAVDIPAAQSSSTEPAAPASTPAGEAPNEGRAALSVNALPWAEVSVDGRDHGTTPLRKLKLRPGSHVVQLRCPPLGREQKLKLELARGADARLVVHLDQDPPRTFLDGANELR